MSTLDLASLSWQLTGVRPFVWRWGTSMEVGTALRADIAPVPVSLPSSVQNALLQADVLEDWHYGLKSRDCEWVEHRHWVFETVLPVGSLPADDGLFLCADGLDYSGWVLVDGVEIGTFKGALIPHEWELPELDSEVPHRLQIVFDTPPEEQGQVGYTSQSRFFKPRYNFSWDWCPRFVPIGIWDDLRIETETQRAVKLEKLVTRLGEDNATGFIELKFESQWEFMGHEEWPVIEIAVKDGEKVLLQRVVTMDLSIANVELELPVEPWWPNGAGESKLYTLEILAGVQMCDVSLDFWERTEKIGFKRVEWRDCEEAPKGALPWICVVNGQPLFLQGANWTPVRMNYHDVTRADYAEVLGLYKEMGANVLRVWGGAMLEKRDFYQLCDEMGIMVWQEFPLSSSGIDNWPPEDAGAIATLEEIAVSYVKRRRQHVSLLLWCGGNELQGALDGGKIGIGLPATLEHPCLAALQAIVEEHDPTRRFLHTSASGPRFMADEAHFGEGLHHDVHGPWALGDEQTMEQWRSYWDNNDSLFRSETGLPGTSSLELMEKYAAGEAVWPTSTRLWSHSSSWWVQEKRFGIVTDEGDLAAYIEWSQQEQAEGLTIAARACKDRFPKCGGFLVWMGHDCFPCLANTSVIDFDRRFKPSGLALREVFRS